MIDISYRSQLTTQELEQIHALISKAARKTRYKIDPGLNSGIVCRTDGMVSAFMTVDFFGGGCRGRDKLGQDV